MRTKVEATYTFGDVIKNPFHEEPHGGDWIEINAPGHSGFALVVWRMTDDERTPECEAAAQFLLDALNASLKKDPA